MGLKGDWVMDFLSSFLLCRRTNQCFILKHCRALTRAQWHAASPWLVLEPEISDRKHEKRMCTMRLFQHQSCASGHLISRSEETRLNSSHQIISYAVFCLKKKITITVS